MMLTIPDLQLSDERQPSGSQKKANQYTLTLIRLQIRFMHLLGRLPRLLLLPIFAVLLGAFLLAFILPVPLTKANEGLTAAHDVLLCFGYDDYSTQQPALLSSSSVGMESCPAVSQMEKDKPLLAVRTSIVAVNAGEDASLTLAVLHLHVGGTLGVTHSNTSAGIAGKHLSSHCYFFATRQ